MMAIYTTSVRSAVTDTIRRNRPENHVFFETMSIMPPAKLFDPVFLGQTYNFCQSVMHILHLAVLKAPGLGNIDRHQLRLNTAYENLSNLMTVQHAFEEMGAETMWPVEMFSDLPGMRKVLSQPLYHALENLDRAYQNSLGAWCLSEQAMVRWTSAMQAAFGRGKPRETCKFLTYEHGEDVCDIVQSAVEAAPHLDGIVTRGIDTAMREWLVIWDLQYQLVRAHGG